MTVDQIEREITVDAPLERVWEVVTGAEHLGTWFADAGAEIDLRPGGALLLRWKEYGESTGRVITVERPRTFAFRWALSAGEEPGDGNSTLVEFALAADSDGRTRVHVVESGFSTLDLSADEQAKRVEGNTEGWRLELDELAAYVTSAA